MADRELGDVGTEFKFEDDDVKVWDLGAGAGAVERLAPSHEPLCVHRYAPGHASDGA